MSLSVRGVAAFLARLRYFVPALALCALAGFIEHPAVLVLLLLAQPLFLAAVVSALDYGIEDNFAPLALRRGSAFLVLLVGYAAFVALVLGTPTVRLAQGATPLNALLVSAGFVLSVLALWRLWPAFGLVFVWDDAYPENENDSWIATALKRSLAFASHLTRERDPLFGRGLPVALGLLLVVAGAMSLAGLCGLLPNELRLTALALYALLLCPLVHLLLAQRCERLLLDEAADGDVPDDVVEPESVAVLAPADPAIRTAQLRVAAAQGKVDLALALLEAGARADFVPEIHDRDQRSLAMVAATCPDLRLLRALIARGAELNRAVGGTTPLHAATRDSQLGRPDAVLTLIANGADPRVADAEGNTPLHHAALSREATVAAFLLDAGADPDVPNREGLTPLGVACAAGNEALVRALLERGAKADAPRAVSALIAAASGADDRPALVKLFARQKAQVDARDKLGRSALHAAALHGHAETVDALLAAGADIDARDAHGVTALMEAARGGSNRVLQRLVFRKPNPDPVDQSGRSALAIACQSRQANDETVRLLLALGADPALASKDGRRAIDYAVHGGRWTLVALIDPMFPLPNALDDDGVEAPVAGDGPDRAELLRGALRHGRVAVAKELLLLPPAWSETELAEAYAVAAQHADPAGCRVLLAHGLPPDACDAQHVALLPALLAQRPLPVAAVELVLAAGAAAGGLPLARLLEGNDDDALQAALERLVLDLLERGADPFARDTRGRSALHLAAARARIRLLEVLLERGLDPNASDAWGRRPLHELAALPEPIAVPLAQRLLLAGADPSRAAADGQTPLGAALAAARGALARWLSWPHTFRHPGRRLWASDLPVAAALGDTVAVERLLELGLDVDARDAQGCTALLRACGAGHAEVVATLLERGADVRIPATTGASCLSAAVSARREAIVALLLDRGVEADQPLPGGSTPLMVAAALGLNAIVDLLLRRGADATRCDEHGNGALHAAGQFCFQSVESERCRQLLKRLISAGVPADRANAQAQTPLLLLLGARVEASAPAPQRALVELMDLLLAQGAEANAQDLRGVSCLHAAAMHGRLDACEGLLRAGADPAAQDRLGRSAHEVALMLGYADVAAALKRVPGTAGRGAAGARPGAPR